MEALERCTLSEKIVQSFEFHSSKRDKITGFLGFIAQLAEHWSPYPGV